MKEISVVVTSYNRPDLLTQTVDSFNEHNTYPIKDFIIIEDSADRGMREFLKHHFSNYTVVFNEKNIGAYASIDKAYAMVTTPFVMHTEDDWLFTRGGFILPAIEVLCSDPEIMQVNLSNEESIEIEPEFYKAGNTLYRIMGSDINGWWHGFTCRPSVRSMAGYERTKPWTKYYHEDLSIHECYVGLEYHRLGYKAAVLEHYYCKHIGLGRCTWHEN